MESQVAFPPPFQAPKGTVSMRQRPGVAAHRPWYFRPRVALLHPPVGSTFRATSRCLADVQPCSYLPTITQHRDTAGREGGASCPAAGDSHLCQAGGGRGREGVCVCGLHVLS